MKNADRHGFEVGDQVSISRAPPVPAKELIKAMNAALVGTQRERNRRRNEAIRLYSWIGFPSGLSGDGRFYIVGFDPATSGFTLSGKPPGWISRFFAWLRRIYRRKT